VKTVFLKTAPMILQEKVNSRSVDMIQASIQYVTLCMVAGIKYVGLVTQ
jgi:hypothetical protein